MHGIYNFPNISLNISQRQDLNRIHFLRLFFFLFLNFLLYCILTTISLPPLSPTCMCVCPCSLWCFTPTSYSAYPHTKAGLPRTSTNYGIASYTKISNISSHQGWRRQFSRKKRFSQAVNTQRQPRLPLLEIPQKREATQAITYMQRT